MLPALSNLDQWFSEEGGVVPEGYPAVSGILIVTLRVAMLLAFGPRDKK